MFIFLISTVGIIYWFRQDQSHASVDKLYSIYYTPYSITIDYRSDIGPISADYQSALEKYENLEYQEALALFEQILDNKEDGVSAFFFAGICNMELGIYEQAIHYFKLPINQDNMMFGQQSNWYLALCYLKTNQINKAKKILERISQENKYKQIEAEELLDQL